MRSSWAFAYICTTKRATLHFIEFIQRWLSETKLKSFNWYACKVIERSHMHIIKYFQTDSIKIYNNYVCVCARARERDNNCAYNAHLHKYVFVKSDLNWIELGQAYKNNNNSPNQFVCCTGWMMAAADVLSFSLIFTLSHIAREFWPLLTLMATAVASVTKIKTNLLLASTTHVKIPNCQSISFSNANEHRDLQFKECLEEKEREMSANKRPNDRSIDHQEKS